MTPEAVLRALAAHDGISGARLAQRLGVTRAAVWKQVERLRALGVQIDALAGRGYRLVRPLELLDAARLQAGLSLRATELLRGLDLAFELDSTSSALLRLRPGDAHACVCLAEYQHGGRGRRGRRWHSPLASNLYASFGWRFDAGAASLSGLSLAIGVAAHAAVERVGARGVALKWPNDLVAEGRKLGGILIELGGELAGPCDAVIGIGINVAMPEDPGAIDQPFTDLAALAPGVTRHALAVALIDEVLPALARFEREGYAPFRAAYERADALRDAPVVIELGRERIEGTALGVDDAGLLRVRVDGTERRYASGEVSVRRA
ncbi:MAG TPA: biotin--[acetyl-CoA-carboxylase] ligase [Xanthomonadales bacterium]|nr:biotin--[acetyl-CoA-carboxylase] ligase [Xanthomonadales bacterium]